MQMIEQMIQGATVSLGMLSWWACACRIGAMHPSTHRAEAIGWHLAAAVLALWVVGMAVWRPGDQLSLWTAGSLWVVMWRTWDEWADGVAPDWTWRRERRVLARHSA
jgi:hypothetical protein